MRQECTIQASIFDVFSQHELGRELKAMSDLLDDHREVCGWVAAELRRHGLKPTGRKGLPAETVLRCGVLKQHRQLSYQELAFYLTDSATFRAFARLPVHWTPKKSVLQNTISAISAATWERINRHLLRQARTAKLESGEMLRVDSTVTDAPVHPPTDSSLLWDSVRMMVRLLGEADDLLAGLGWRNHSRRAKKRSRSIQFCRSADKRKRLYRDLLKVTRATLDYVDAAMARLTAARLADIKVEAWLAAVRQYRPLIARIIAQTERRVLDGEQVPAADKLVSLFEPHTDIIVKGSREVQYGHKLNLSTGKDRHDPGPGDRGRQPGRYRPVPADAGSSHRALWQGAAPERRRRRLCQHRQPGPGQGLGRQGRGLPQEARAGHRGHGEEPLGVSQARNFRAGIEANISCLKRPTGSAAAPGKAWITSRPTSGPRSWPTISPCSPASSRPSSTVSADAGHRAAPGPKACR